MVLAALIAFTFINTGRQDGGAVVTGSNSTDDENAGDIAVPVFAH
jgi:hypothetical protein